MSTSPFEIFRRNLKPLMVLLTGLALFAFVVLPVVDSYMRQNSGGGGNAVVAKFGGKAITQSRVDYFTRNHNETIGFLKKLADATIARGGVPRTAGFQYDPQSKQVMRLGINQNPSYEGSVRTMMFADSAKEAGFELDDNAIQSWLDRFTDGMVSDNDIATLLMSSTQNRMAAPHLYEQLRSHLLADVYLKRGYAGLYSGDNPSAGALLTPVEQWEAFEKLNRSATIDAYGVMVNDYLEQTNANPSQELITATYDEGKDRDPNDQSPEPAFHRRYTASFEILEGNLEKFLDEEIAQLTEEELRAEYDKRVAGGAFQVPEKELDELLEGNDTAEPPADNRNNGESNDPGESASKSDDDTEAEMTEAEAAPEESAGDQSAEETVGEQEATKESSDTQAEQASGEKEPAKKESAEKESTTEDQPADEPAESESAEESPSDDEQGRLSVNRAMRLVALQQEEQAGSGDKSADDSSDEKNPAGEESIDEPASDEKPADEKPADEKPADEKPADEKPADEKPADEKPADEPTDESQPTEPAEEGEPAETEMKEESNNPDSTEADQPASTADNGDSPQAGADDDKPAEESEEDATAEPQVESFEDVRERLERELAFPAAQKRMNEAATKIYKSMQSYFTQRAIHESNVAVGQGDEPPTRPDLKAMAEAAGFEFRTVDSRDQITISEDPAAFSMDAQTPFGGRGPNFTMMMYGYSIGNEIVDPRELFTPLQTADFMSGKVFVSWKTEDRDAYTPTLEEVREEVIEYLRMKEAKVLAMAAAEELAEQAAEENGKSLADLVPEDRQDNLKTGLGPFKWLDSVGRGVAFGNVPELDSVGEAFMEAVFSAEIGEYRVAPNAPERVIYIVSPTDFEPSVDELRQRFREPSNRRMLTAIDAGIGGVLGDFYEAVDEQAGFENLMVSE